jgi:hypothetical protein
VVEPFTVMVGRLESRQRKRLKEQKVSESAPKTKQTEKILTDDELGRPQYKHGQGVPPPGMYNPKLVLGHVPTPILRKPLNPNNMRPASGLPFADKSRMTEDDLNYNPDKLHRYVPGYVELGKKADRRPINDQESEVDPEGRQFEVREIPRVSSKYR